MKRPLFFVALALAAAPADPWLASVEPAMTAGERRLYRGLANPAEAESFRKVFWSGKAISESAYLERTAYADGAFGSGKAGSGANTEQGRLYIANGPPSSVHRVPSSRLFVPTEVWYYESLPRTGYNSRLQFLFYRRNGIGDFRLYSPQLQSIRDLLIPQPGTRLMFPVNDLITRNDIDAKLKYSPAEQEIVEAAIGVARGVTGAGGGEILGRAASISHMLTRDKLTPGVESNFRPAVAPEVGTMQFWAGDIPVVDVQVRVRAVASVGLAVEEQGEIIEQSQVPLDRGRAGTVLYVQRFFLLPGAYRLRIEADGQRIAVPLIVQADKTMTLSGEGLAEQEGELKLALTPDPASGIAREALQRQEAGRAARKPRRP